MAAGSDNSWQDFPVELRVCHGCGGKLTLRMHLWIEERPEQRAWHAACAVAAFKSKRQAA